MDLKPEVKTALLEAGEESIKTAFDQVIKVSRAYANSTENTTVDDKIVDGVELVKKAFLDDLVEEINPEG